jgi:crossover junction endodeoxyribonuclease RuvC
VALDLSLTGTGLAWTHNGLGQPDPGARTIRVRTDGHQRIEDIVHGIGDVCLSVPDLVVIEMLPLYAGKGDTTIQLAELHGVVKQWLYQLRFRYCRVHPAQLKQYAVGKGSGVASAKPLVTRAAQRRYHPVRLATSDEADAFVLAAMAADHYGHPIAPVPDLNRRALLKVRWPALDSPVFEVDA